MADKMGRQSSCLFIAGGTGYLGTRWIAELVQRGHSVRALARDGSAQKLPSGCTPILGNALDKNSYEKQIQPADTFVHLVQSIRTLVVTQIRQFHSI